MNRRNFLLTTAAAACATSGRSWANTAKSVFRWVPSVDLTLLDPMYTTSFITQIHSQLVFDTLYGQDELYQPSPQMAQGHARDDAGLRWTITLRDGLAFHDDTPVRARDAIASIQRWAKKDMMGNMLMQATRLLTAPNDRTLLFQLNQPFPLILHTLARQTACIMPERLAQLPETEAVREMVGSGPFRFAADRWVSGSRVVYEKFARYTPREDKTAPIFTAGPKRAHVDEVHWYVIADRATAVAALQANEIDGIEVVDTDFLPILRQDPNIQLIKRSLPVIVLMRFNHLHAPFNNPAIRRAVLAAVNQTEYMTAVNGSDFPEYWTDRCGVFMPGSPMDSDAGMEKLTGKRDIAAARTAIKAAGYDDAPVVILDPSDFPVYHASALITADLFKRLGFKVDVQTMDWGTLMQRRNSQQAPAAGGWNVAFTGLLGPNFLDPAAHLPLRGNGKDAWFGWPTNQRIEQLRLDWFNAPDLAAQKRICRDIQLQVFEDVPYIPLGAYYRVTALRNTWKDFQPQMPLFYTLRKA